jgi:hypothetical protein
MKSLVRLALGILITGLVAVTTADPAAAVCASGGTVSNVADCIPVGKGSKDCFLEWSVVPVPPPDNNGFPTSKIDCVDNTACDLDATPGQCTFSVGACVNVAAETRFACTASDAAVYDLKAPSAKDFLKKSHKNPFNRANHVGLDGALASIVPSGVPNLCSDHVDVVVPLKVKFVSGNPVYGKGKGKIGVKLADSANQKDSDTLKLTCLPNPAIDTQPIASARQIASAAELIGGPLAMGRVDDYLIENDKVRFIVRNFGRDFSFMLTYGGHLIDADLQRKKGSAVDVLPWGPPYPPGQDSFLAMTPLINISSTDNPQSVTVVSSGATGGPAILETLGPDDLFDPIDPFVAIKGFNQNLSVPASARDVNITTDIVNRYTLRPGDAFLEMETIVKNTGGAQLDIYVGDYTSAGGQLEIVAPGLGFGEGAARLGADLTPSAGSPQVLPYAYLGWLGFGEAAGLTYALIPEVFNRTSSFTQSGVVVPIYGQNLLGVLFAGDPGTFSIPAGGMNAFRRWFAISDNGMGKVLDARHTLFARGQIPLVAGMKPVKTGVIQGVVTAGGQPLDGARVAIVLKPGDRASQVGLVTAFETRDGGHYQGTLPKGSYIAMVKAPGYPYESSLATPTEKLFKIGGGTTTVDFALPATGWVQVLVEDGNSPGTPIPAKVSVVGLEKVPDPGISETAPFLSLQGNIFGYDALEKVTIFGLPQARFAGPNGDTGVFPVPPGDYQFVVSRGPRWDAFKTAVTAVPAGTPGSPLVINAALRKVVDTPGYISSDHHVHMINSPDSVVSKRERIVTMLAEEVDYFVATDHDFVTDLSADVAALGATSLVKTAPSDEITYFNSGHFNAFPLTHDPASLTGGAIDWGDATALPGMGYPSDNSYDLSPHDMVLLVKGPPYNAIVVQANHFNSGTLGYFRVHGIDTTVSPPQSSTSPTELRQDPSITNLYTDELTALEIWIENSRGQNALATGENLGDWFNLLNSFDSSNPKRRKAGVADSDTHSVAVVQAGGPRTLIASSNTAPALIDPDEVAQNLNDGRAVMTNAPFLRVTLEGDGGATVTHDLTSPSLVVPASVGGSVKVKVQVQSPTWAEFDKIEIYHNNVPPCVTVGPSFVGGFKEVCTPAPDVELFRGTDFFLISQAFNGSTRWVTLPQVVEHTLAISEDTWIVVIVRGRDGVSRPLFPMSPTSTLRRRCANDPCKSCNINSDCTPFTCVDENTTVTALSTITTGECGVRALAIANPLFADQDGDGLFRGVAIP